MACKFCKEEQKTIKAKLGSGINYSECSGCGVVCQDPLPDLSSLQAIYRSQEQNYFIDEQKGVDYLKGERWLRGTAKFYARLIKKYNPQDWAGLKVLDFGCATGVFLDELRKLGSQVQGIELSGWASDYGRRSFGLDIINKDIAQVDFPAGHFDLITLIHVIEHLADPDHVIKKLSTWLKPGGLLVIATPDGNSLGAKIFKNKWYYYIPHEHLYLFSPLSLKKLLIANKFKVIGIEPYLWRKRSQGAALLILLYSVFRFLVRKVFISRKLRFHCGTAKDGMVVFSKKVSD